MAKNFNFETSTGFNPEPDPADPAPPDPGRDAVEGVGCWGYDKADFSLRLDTTAGTFKEILLEAKIEAQLQISSAAKGQIRGAARLQISRLHSTTSARRMTVSLRSMPSPATGAPPNPNT